MTRRRLLPLPLAGGGGAVAEGRPVCLFPFVKVRENWTDDPERYHEIGLDFTR